MPMKRASFQVRIFNHQHHVFKLFWINFKNRNMCLRYLKMDMYAVWISNCLVVKGFIPGFISFGLYVFIAVGLTKVSSLTVPTFW